MFKAVVFTALVAVANAGIIGAPLGYAASPYAAGYASPALVSQQSNILRTPGNLGQVSTYSKTISTPYSSVSKSDVRVSNDALAYPGVVAHGYAAPAIAHGYAAPAIAHGYAAPAIAHGYAAPAIAHGYAAPAVLAAPRLAAPAVLAAPRVAVASPVGVSYSAAPVVSHISFDGIGAHFAY